MTNRGRLSFLKCFMYVALTLAAIVFLLPYYWMVVNSFKSMGEFYNPVTSILPTSFKLENYVALFQTTAFVPWLSNSFIVSIASCAIGILICSLAGYAFAVYDFKGKSAIFWIIIGSVAIPEIVTIIPVFKLMANFGLIDTYGSLILPYSMNVFGIFLMKEYIGSSFPSDLLDAARIDGAREARIYFQIALPLVRPGLGVLGIYLWLNSWSGYFWPLIMLKSTNMLTVPLGLSTLYADPWNLQYGVLMAGALISTLPIIILFLTAQEQFIAGLTGGAVKG